MEEFLPSELRKLRLSRSEPFISQQRQIDQLSHSFKRSNPYTTRLLGKNKSKVLQPHPPTRLRQQITVVSPQRKVRIPVESLNDLCRRHVADGASSSCSGTVDSEAESLQVRLPGDGCYSDDSQDELECGDKAKQNISSSIFSDNDLVEGEVTGEDFEEDLTDLSDEEWKSSQASSSLFDLTESRESGCSTPSLRLQSSNTSVTEDFPLPLLKSIFPNKPPTLYFTTEKEKISQFPMEIRGLLKWRTSTVTPKVVKECLARTGFHLTKRSNDWLGTWGKHMKPIAFKSIKEFQKINHFPGTFHIGRKDKLWRSYSRMKSLHGQKEFNFLPQTFVLPQDMLFFKKAWDDCSSKPKWIVKPPASARGYGIKVIHKWSQVPKKRPVVAQRYVSKPYLINGCKFDLRIYVYVSSYDPLRIYIFQDGLVRFATTKYSSSSKSFSNKFIHLTNYSINKKNLSVYNTDDINNNEESSYKWSLKTLWSYLYKNGHDYRKVWQTIKDIATKAIICGEAAVNSQLKQNLKSRYSCHELFGLDILLDNNLKPWLLEVNISPSLHSQSKLDKSIKGQLVKDIFNICGFFIPKHLIQALTGNRCHTIDDFGADWFWFQQRAKTSEEKSKHTFYIQRSQDMRVRSTILDKLTPDDLIILMETEDEFSRCGEFERMLPVSSQEKSYIKYFETPRYYDLLLDEWIKRYMRDAYRPAIGISVLMGQAQDMLHLNAKKKLGSQCDSRSGSSRTNTSRSLPTIKRKKKLSTATLKQTSSTPVKNLIKLSISK